MNTVVKKPLSEIEPERLYGVKEVLEFLPISKSCLYKWLKEKKIPYISLQRRKLLMGKVILKALKQ